MISFNKKFEKKVALERNNVFHFLDDILILGNNETEVFRHVSQVTRDLMDAGFKINIKKSQIAPTQMIHHLGFDLNLHDGRLQIPSHKLKHLRRDLGRL